MFNWQRTRKFIRKWSRGNDNWYIFGTWWITNQHFFMLPIRTFFPFFFNLNMKVVVPLKSDSNFDNISSTISYCIVEQIAGQLSVFDFDKKMQQICSFSRGIRDFADEHIRDKYFSHKFPFYLWFWKNIYNFELLWFWRNNIVSNCFPLCFFLLSISFKWQDNSDKDYPTRATRQSGELIASTK